MRKITGKIWMVLLLGLFQLGLAAPSFAESNFVRNQGGTFTLDPFTGGYVFIDQHKNHGYYYGLRAGYNFTPHWAAEGMFGYTATEDYDLVNAHGNDLPINVYRFGLDALYNFNPKGKVVPFLAVGIGLLSFDNPYGWKDYNFGLFNYGAGIKWFLADAVALRGDVRHVIFPDDNEFQNNLEFTLGLNFQLGAEKRKVAMLPQAADTSAPTVVCTSPDNGVTGVATDRNVIATFDEAMDPEMINPSTFTLKQGATPVPGKVTLDGSNAADFNPDSELNKGTTYTATMAAGVKDPAGNALAKSYVWSFTTVPAPKAAVPVVLIVLEDNNFEFDKSDVTPAGAVILDENIKILKTNPKVRIRIAGYTSAQGTEEYNQALSERRAEAVQAYLVKGGIAADRLVTIGFGRTRPAEFEAIPENMYSKEAKANMRVLFEVIVK